MRLTVLQEERADEMGSATTACGSAGDPPDEGASSNSAGGAEPPEEGASEDFSLEQFFDWLAEWAGRIGKSLLEKALVAWYVATDDRTPDWAKATLVGALVYLGFPIDAVPDFVPFAGFADDALALALALTAVITSVRWRHVRQARQTMRSWGIDTEDLDPGLDDDGQASPYV